MRRSGAHALALTAMVAGVFMLACGAPPAALAQVKRLGMMANSLCPTQDNPLLLGPLAARGWVEGKTLTVDCLVVGNRLDKLPDLAAEMVARRPDVVVAAATPYIRALTRVTSSTPIVMLAISDPVGAGLVASLSRPGGNVTGLSSVSLELFGKRMEALSELAGRPKRLAVITRVGGDAAVLATMAQEADRAAKVLGFEWKAFAVGTAADFAPIFAQISAEKFDAVYVIPTPQAVMNSRLVAELALRHRLPAAGDLESAAADGLVMTFGLDFDRVFDVIADYVDRLFRGANPVDLPVRQPVDFKLVINARTASALGLAIPVSILNRADKVIE